MKIRCFTLILLTFTGYIFGKIFVPDNVTYLDSSDTRLRIVENKAFTVGEKLDFELSYGFITAGFATIEVSRIDTVKNRPCYVLTTTARSRESFDWIFKVRDLSESYLDTERFHSLKFFKKIREGSYKIDVNIVYDQFKKIAHYSYIRYKDKIKRKKKVIKITENVVDALSALFFVRTMNIKVGDEVILPGTNNKKIYPIKVIVHKKDKIKTDVGKFNCLVVEPVMADGAGIFKNDGTIKVWLTDDEYKIPVKMESKVFVGSIKADLIKLKRQ